MQWRRAPFSLLEILIAMALLTVLSGVVAVPIYRAVGEARYVADVRKAAHLLDMAQQVAVARSTWVSVVWKRSDAGVLEGKFDFLDTALNDHRILGKTHTFCYIPILYHKGEVVDDERVIAFRGTDGPGEGAGMIAFGNRAGQSEEECPYKIALLPYPTPLQAVKHLPHFPTEDDMARDCERLVPKELVDVA